MIEEMLAELKELDKLALAIAKRVWKHSPEATDLQGVPLTAANIQIQVELLADKIVEHYPDNNPVLVGLMDGATPFADLLRHALNRRQYDYNYTTMSVSSYRDTLVSGELDMGALPKVTLFGRPVIVLDDVCDTGKTLKAIKNLFLTQYPDSVKLMVLVNKGQERPEGIDADYIGFELSHASFIIGMGLDYLQELRNTDSIKAANPQYLPSPEEKIKLERRNYLRKQIGLFIKAQNLEKQQIIETQSALALTAPSTALSFFGASELENKDQIVVSSGVSFSPGLSPSESDRT
ncbi:phosphoribosyltransferase [uncultured Legionella sp.]|uniref:phosphoribosyltransferase n=1 Tax=uncultured Legionella sp. TaxID=210934 RepID=UPI00260BEB6B|nr:phosphoribosyltransferase family protein [uncultured Legionella sp.]